MLATRRVGFGMVSLWKSNIATQKTSTSDGASLVMILETSDGIAMPRTVDTVAYMLGTRDTGSCWWVAHLHWQSHSTSNARQFHIATCG